MKKINLAITGCFGRMGQQLIKSSKNAKNFNYNRTQIIIHKQDTSKFIDEIINILKISPQLVIYNYNDYNIHEMTVIIGSDYNNLDSFEEVSMHYEPF